MLKEPGLYIVKERETRSDFHRFLWIYDKGGVLHYKVDNGGSSPLNREGEIPLDDRFVLKEKLHIHRNELEFSNTEITVTTSGKGGYYRFSMRTLAQLYSLIRLLPGLGRSLMLRLLVKRIKNDFKKASR